MIALPTYRFVAFIIANRGSRLTFTVVISHSCIPASSLMIRHRTSYNDIWTMSKSSPVSCVGSYVGRNSIMLIYLNAQNNIRKQARDVHKSNASPSQVSSL